jgi:hypothetical protein
VIDWKELGEILITVTAVLAGLFVVIYGLLAPWWRSAEGRNIMGVMGTLFVGLGYYGWAVSQGGTPEGAYPIRALLFTALTAFLAQRIFVLIRAQLWTRSGKGSSHVEEVREVDRDAAGDARDGRARRVP